MLFIGQLFVKFMVAHGYLKKKNVPTIRVKCSASISSCPILQYKALNVLYLHN